MEIDKDTLDWIGTLIGRSHTISVISVGDGPYGLMSVIKCGTQEERNWRYVGFQNAKAARDFSVFLRASEAAGNGTRERLDEARRRDVERHAIEHVRWDVFCMNGVVEDEMLERISGI